jgi:hypothetical protein
MKVVSTVVSTTVWDDDFFLDFVTLRNSFYEGFLDFIPEDIEDLKKILSPHAPFNKNNKWKAVLLKDGDKSIGRIFYSTRTDHYKQMDFLPVGYIEADCQDTFNELIRHAEEFGKNEGYKQLRGPIEGNVFNSSRLLITQNDKHFFTEPFFKREYLNYLEINGFKSFQTWVSWKSTIFGRISSIQELLGRSKKNKRRYTCQNKKKEFKIRDLKLNNWDQEMDIFYDLLMDSFSEFKDVEYITKEELKVYLDDLKYILLEKHCLILEVDNKPIGFVCALLDFQKELSLLKNNPSLINKIRFFLKKKLSLGRVLVLYIGKKKESEDQIKGIAVKLLKALTKRNLGFPLNPVIFGYMQKGTKISSLMAKNCKVISSYGTFFKNIT